ncbi:MAG: hypothetical protein ABR558_04940, partial [Thioalkalivibrio sp.]
MCVIDTKPREPFTADGLATLTVLAELVVSELELRRTLLVSRDRVELLARLNNGILLIEGTESLEALPALAASAAREVMQASCAQVTLDLSARGGEHVTAFVPPDETDAAREVLLLAV